MLRVLVADDEKDARDRMIRCVDKFQNGLTIVGAASDGYETYDKIISLCPDIVLIDIEMPGMSGLEVIRKIREAKLLTVFIIISSYNEFSYAQEALHLKVEEYLLKPFLPADVCRAIYKAAEHIQTVNMLPHLKGVLPVPENQFLSFNERMKSPVVYPFDLENDILNSLQSMTTLEQIDSCLNAFIAAVHKNNAIETAIMNCYVILYVELHRFIINLGSDFDFLSSSLNRNIRDIRDPVIEIEKILCLLCREIYNLLSAKQSSGKIIPIAIKYIDEYYAKDLSLGEVANYIGVSSSYLSDQFSQVMHIHFIDYIHKVRINHSMELMKSQPYLKGYEVGEMVGYNSFKYFSYMFRKVTGITISQFRKQIEVQ